MNALPLLTTVATDAIRGQFAASPVPAREPERLRTAPSRWRARARRGPGAGGRRGRPGQVPPGALTVPKLAPWRG